MLGIDSLVRVVDKAHKDLKTTNRYLTKADRKAQHISLKLDTLNCTIAELNDNIEGVKICSMIFIAIIAVYFMFKVVDKK
jgi:hypothetical protein